MTKVTVFGKQEDKRKKKPIEFVYWIDDRGNKCPIGVTPHWENITLLNRSYYDVFFVWDDDPQKDGCVYLGHWNDGVVK